MENEVRSLKGLLRRTSFMVPGIHRVGGHGCSDLQAAAEAEGFQFDQETPDLWIVWAPEKESLLVEPVPESARAVSVTARSLSNLPLPFEGGKRPAKLTLTLREWVMGWPLGTWISPLLASDAVGARTCSVHRKDVSEFLFLAAPATVKSEKRGGPAEWAVTFFGAGLFPIMPATLASALMVPPALLIQHYCGGQIFQWIAVAVAILSTLASVLLEGWAGRRFLAEDPREFVLDEVAGMAVTWAMLPPGSPIWLIGVGFLFFRIFDIFKWGVHWVEGLPIRGKIVWDDVLAGVYAGLATWLINLIFA